MERRLGVLSLALRDWFLAKLCRGSEKGLTKVEAEVPASVEPSRRRHVSMVQKALDDTLWDYNFALTRAVRGIERASGQHTELVILLFGLAVLLAGG